MKGCLAHICAAWSLGMFTFSSLVQFKVSGQKSHDPVKLNKRLRCHVCRIRQKKRKTTFFTCSSCTDEKDNKFGLCMPECFNEFHNERVKDKDKDGDLLRDLEGTFTAQAEGDKMTAAAVKTLLTVAGVAEEELKIKLDKLGTTLTFQQFHDILQQFSNDKKLTS
ncbi:hypothetical protein J6590_011785 [Homalodisca vitripennis]|nr:hypothetical protein J6590_011785 [Homalodisca vitripennis]